MSAGGLVLEPETLWPRAAAVGAQALQSGALQPIPTCDGFVEESGVRFLVRVVEGPAREHRAFAVPAKQPSGTARRNPILPYEEELFVATISDTHVALLNKFPVIDDHLLIVTRSFEDQETLLCEADFRALWACLGEGAALAFYNGGRAAGASQRHKHLQIVPLPLAAGLPELPVEGVLAAAEWSGPVGRAPGLPFAHAVSRVDPDWIATPAASGAPSREAFELLRERAGLGGGAADRQSAPYNLLVTHQWMLLVPRSRESFGTISVNALGFAGALLVRSDEEMQTLREAGPLRVLRDVARSP